jgi:8-oxo-dGTP pyrophosphatase MutT (NUDIX family)
MTEEKEWVDWQNTKVLQKAVVMDEEGNILTLRRVETGPASRLGKEDLPGGSLGPEDLIDSTKPYIEAIKREIKQETGLEVIDIESVFVDSWVFTRSSGKILGLAIGYKAKVMGVKPIVTISDEHIDYKWRIKEEALGADFGDDGGLHKSILQKV